MIIVIDGPSGSGKSTLARRLSKDLNLPYFDTGAMYRSFAWFLVDQKVSPDDLESIKELLEKMDFEIKTLEGAHHYFVNGIDVTKEIRAESVSKCASQISTHLFVRKHLVQIQRHFGATGQGIYEGRDMGTVVFPEAEIKFFLQADPKIRAMRRFEQMKADFPNKKFDKETVLEELIRRDEQDSTREHSPLRRAKDAKVIDVTHLSIEDVLKKIKAYIREKQI